jgi:phage anti-repressor protein
MNHDLISFQNGERISARQLHSFLGSNQKFADWIGSRIKKFNILEGEGFFVNLGKTSEAGGRPTKEYLLTFETAIIIASGENTEQGRNFITFFIQKQKNREEQLTTKCRQLEISNNSLIYQLSETNKKYFRLKDDKALILTKNVYGLEEGAEVIGICKIKFCQRLRDYGYLEYRQEYRRNVNVPTYRAEGLIFKSKKIVYGIERTQSFITQKGMLFFHSKKEEFFNDIRLEGKALKSEALFIGDIASNNKKQQALLV